MTELYKYEKEVDVTYFKKIKKVKIEDVSEGELVYLKVRSPLNYGTREWGYYGKIIKKTNYYFDILNYNEDTIDYFYTNEIEKINNNPDKHTKRWAKKSIIEIYVIQTENEIKLIEYYTNDKANIKK